MAKMKGAIVVNKVQGMPVVHHCLPSEGYRIGQQSESTRLPLRGGCQRGGLRGLCIVWHRLPRWVHHRVS